MRSCQFLRSRSLGIKPVLLICLAIAWIPALACKPALIDNSATATDLAWSVKADFNSTQVSSLCDDAFDQILRRFDLRRDVALSLEAFAPAWGSVSLGLAKISAVAMQIQQTLHKKAARRHIPIEIRLSPTSGGQPRPADSRHFILRLRQDAR